MEDCLNPGQWMLKALKYLLCCVSQTFHEKSQLVLMLTPFYLTTRVELQQDTCVQRDEHSGAHGVCTWQGNSVSRSLGLCSESPLVSVALANGPNLEKCKSYHVCRRQGVSGLGEGHKVHCNKMVTSPLRGGCRSRKCACGRVQIRRDTLVLQQSLA